MKMSRYQMEYRKWEFKFNQLNAVSAWITSTVAPEIMKRALVKTGDQQKMGGQALLKILKKA